MVAPDQVLAAIQQGQDRFGPLRAVRHVAKVPHVIIRADGGVPVADQGCIHLRHRFKGALCVADDIGMAEMGVGGKKGLWAAGHVASGLLGRMGGEWTSLRLREQDG
nr:hypothetical protein [Komagataeibacter xylinus]